MHNQILMNCNIVFITEESIDRKGYWREPHKAFVKLIYTFKLFKNKIYQNTSFNEQLIAFIWFGREYNGKQLVINLLSSFDTIVFNYMKHYKFNYLFRLLVMDESLSVSKCLRFYYTMNGFHTGALRVYRLINDVRREFLWEMSGDKLPGWHIAVIDINMTSVTEVSC